MRHRILVYQHITIYNTPILVLKTWCSNVFFSHKDNAAVNVWFLALISQESPYTCLGMKLPVCRVWICMTLLGDNDLFSKVVVNYRPTTYQSLQSIQLLIRVQLFATPWTAARQASLSISNTRSPPKLMSIELVMPSNRLIIRHPLLLLPSIFPNIRVFSKESALCIRWPKQWSFSFNMRPFNEHPGLISFRMDWLDLLAVQGTFKSLLQHHSSKAPNFQCSAFFIVRLSQLYMTTGKTIALNRWTFVDKVMSPLFNMLFGLVITFLPRSKCLLIS